MLLGRGKAGTRHRLFTLHCRDWSRSVADIQPESRLTRKLFARSRRDPVTQLSDLPAPEQSSKVQAVGQQCDDPFEIRGTRIRSICDFRVDEFLAVQLTFSGEADAVGRSAVVMSGHTRSTQGWRGAAGHRDRRW